MAWQQSVVVARIHRHEKLCSRTGFAWEEALAVDVAAYAGYYAYMLYIENKLGFDVDDMMADFIDWKK